MNILHISRTMGQGGAEKVVYQICKEKKDNIRMIIASTGGAYEEELSKINVKHYTIPDIDNKNPLLMLKSLFTLWKIIKKEKIDVVHSHHRMAAFYSRILNIFIRNFKRVYTAHNVFYNKKKLLQFALKNSKIIAVGKGVKDNLINVYSIPEERIQIIYNSIEKPINIEKPNDNIIKSKKNKVYVATIGRLSEQKGIDTFIKAMKPIIDKNNSIYGIIIGDGELKDELIQLSKDLHIEKNIIFMGYRKDVLNLISCMDFIVLASRWEGFPLTPIETFAMKKTIIVSNIDGNNEIVEDRRNGLLFEKDNVKQLSNKIDFLINNDRKELEDNAFDDYNKKYSYNSFVNSYVDVYEILLKY